MKVRKYLKECNSVYHTTLDPKGPGVVRIHLIPPKKVKPGIPWVAVINGYSVLPLQTAWAILLKEFIKELNKTDGKSISDEELEIVMNHVLDTMTYLFPEAKRKDLVEDIKDIVETFEDIARGKEPSSKIGYLTLPMYAKDMQAPHRMDLMISSMEKNGCWNCNQKCLLCYAGDEKLSKVNELSTNEWYKIIDKCKEANIPALTFTGGEPTLRDDLVDLVAYSSWFVTRLNTNGIRLSSDLCESLYKANLDSVQVTLYSFDEAIHNKMVGGNHFKDTVNGIKNAVKAGLDVSINTPLCSINADYLSTLKFAHELGVTYFSSSGLIPTGYAVDANIEALSKEEITNSLKAAYEYATVNNLEISFTSPGWIDKEELSKMKIATPSCGACLSNMAIAPNGDVIPCQSWLFEDGLGNMLTEKKFINIWNNKKTKKIRNFSIKNTEVCALKEVKR